MAGVGHVLKPFLQDGYKTCHYYFNMLFSELASEERSSQRFVLLSPLSSTTLVLSVPTNVTHCRFVLHPLALAIQCCANAQEDVSWDAACASRDIADVRRRR